MSIPAQSAGLTGANLWFPSEALEHAIRTMKSPRRADRISRQIHLGERRLITQTDFRDDHVDWTAGFTAFLHPKNPSAIAAALNHDEIENCAKLIDRIAAALKNYALLSEEEKAPAVFLKTHVPAIFEKFVEQGYIPRFREKPPGAKLKQLSRWLEQNDHYEIKKSYRDFVITTLERLFSEKVMEALYILTRHTPDEFKQAETKRALKELENFRARCDRYLNLSEGRSKSRQYRKLLKRGGISAEEPALSCDRIWKFLHQQGLTRALPMEAGCDLLQQAAYPQDAGAFTRAFIDFYIREAVIHANIFGQGDDIEKMTTDELVARSSDKRYAAGFSTAGESRFKKILPWVADIKSGDNISNLCTLGFTPEWLKKTGNILPREAYILPHLVKGGMDEDATALNGEALIRSTYNFLQACKRFPELFSSAYCQNIATTAQEEIAKCDIRHFDAGALEITSKRSVSRLFQNPYPLRNPELGWVQRVINMAPGTRLQAA